MCQRGDHSNSFGLVNENGHLLNFMKNEILKHYYCSLIYTHTQFGWYGTGCVCAKTRLRLSLHLFDLSFSDRVLYKSCLVLSKQSHYHIPFFRVLFFSLVRPLLDFANSSSSSLSETPKIIRFAVRKTCCLSSLLFLLISHLE